MGAEEAPLLHRIRGGLTCGLRWWPGRGRTADLPIFRRRFRLADAGSVFPAVSEYGKLSNTVARRNADAGRQETARALRWAVAVERA